MKNSDLFKKAVKGGMKVMYWDIETSPMLVWTYGLFNQNMGVGQIEQDVKITSLAYLYEHSPNTVITDEWEGMDDTLMLERTSEAIESCDLIIGQNGDAFDMKVFAWRVNQLGLAPFAKPLSLDTLKLSRKVFKGSSHKLDYRSKAYGFGGKIHQDMADCIAVAKGDKKIQKERLAYNVKDTVDLRKIFLKELDMYELPVKIVRMMMAFAGVEPTVPKCLSCEERRQAKYNVKIKSGYVHCQRCGEMRKILNAY